MNRFDINTCLFVHIVNLHLINLEEIEGMWLNMSWIHFMSENRTISNEPTLIMNRIVVDMNRCTSNGDTNWVFSLTGVLIFVVSNLKMFFFYHLEMSFVVH